MSGADLVPDDKGGLEYQQDEFCEICSSNEWGPGKKRREQGSYLLGTVKSIEGKVRCPRCRVISRCLTNRRTAADSRSASSTALQQPSDWDEYHLIISDIDDTGDKPPSFTSTERRRQSSRSK